VSTDLGKDFPDRGRLERGKAPSSRGTFFATERAHTLVEIAVALCVVGILAGIGWGVFQDRVSTYRMLAVARMLHSDLHTMRALAIDTNREARIHFLSADAAMDPEDVGHGAWDLQLGNRGSGSTQWDTLPADKDGVIDVSQGERSLEVDGSHESRWVSLAEWGTLEDDSITFTPRGWIGNPGSDFVSGEIELKVVNKRALLERGEEAVVLTVNRSGLVRMQAVAP
jgi:Tfp pilus assembly protein FimT